MIAQQFEKQTADPSIKLSPRDADNPDQSWSAFSDHDREVLQRVSHNLQGFVNSFCMPDRRMESSSITMAADLRSLKTTNSILTRDISQQLDGLRCGPARGLKQDLIAVNYIVDHETKNTDNVSVVEVMDIDEASNSDTAVDIDKETKETRHERDSTTTGIDHWLYCWRAQQPRQDDKECGPAAKVGGRTWPEVIAQMCTACMNSSRIKDYISNPSSP